MSFELCGFRVNGCWDSPNFLKATPGVLIIWEGPSNPDEIIDVFEGANIIHLGQEVGLKYTPSKPGFKIWYSVIYTGDITKEERRLIKEKLEHVVEKRRKSLEKQF